MRAALLAAVLAPAALLACKTVDPGDPAAESPRDRCRREFTQCAPPASYRPQTDVASLEIRKLVHLASRIDSGDLSEKAARRLRRLATEGDAATLVEIEDAMEDTEALLGRCQCKEVRPEIEREEIRALVQARVPPRQLRTPGTWSERIVGKLAEIRDLARRSASLAVAGAADGRDQADGRARALEREVCEIVHQAREMLAAEAFEAMLQDVYLRRETDAGAGSAEAARRTVGAHARSASCEAAPAE